MNLEDIKAALRQSIKDYSGVTTHNGFTITIEFQTPHDAQRILTLLEGKPDWFRDVYDFHEKLGILIGNEPARPDKATILLREKLEAEEWREMLQGSIFNNMPYVADGIVDLIYVLIGRAVSYGIDIRPVWDAVQAANMAKAGGPIREDGKRLKPEGWTPPDVEGIVTSQGPLTRERKS